MIIHVEIPVSDLARAMDFYTSLFSVRFSDPVDLHGSRMAHCENRAPEASASWGLCEGEVYVPTRNGAILYFAVNDMDAILAQAASLGSETLFPKNQTGRWKFRRRNQR